MAKEEEGTAAAYGIAAIAWKLLGRKPRTIRDYIDDHIHLWERE